MARKLFLRNRSLALVVCALTIVAGVFGQRQNIYDHIRLLTYKPPLAVSKLVAQDGLTADGKKLLYINHPQLISSRTTFNSHCPAGSEETVVLGCYHSLEDGIYVYVVSDPTLSGVEQVTAAHEMLHAAYDRLSSSERTQVDGWLEDYYQHDLHDPVILNQIAAYKKSEPRDVVNEMHSVFGTEVATLSPQLESYYKRYFINRQTITTYYADYQQNFTIRQQQVSQDDTTLAQLKSTITANEATLKTNATELSNELQSLNQSQDSGDTASYNAGVPEYNQSVDSYNALVTTTESLVSQYNLLVGTRNALALQTQELENELTGSLTPLAQQ
jgi:hypothetical protein